MVLGRVLEVRPHPDADRLVLVTVDRGTGSQTVVCGAPNVAPGQAIAFAPEGAVLTDPRSGKPRPLKKSRIRGVVSAGMVCSEAELGLSTEHAGILVLDSDRAAGTPLREVLGDRVLVFDLTPNRADALSILGVAREVSALTGAPLTPPDARVERAGPAIAGRAFVEIQDPDLCRRFTLALIEDVELGPAPRWMQERLTAAGMRPINNLVDITNYVMLETGQPVHAFDYDAVRGHRVAARRARPGETLTTLDGKRRDLDPERLVIADPSGPIALAGVMGGLATEITATTRNVLLEVANFEPASVRRTARAFDLLSDAARRFAWGLPPELAPVASARVCRLLAEHAGGRVAEGMLDVWPDPVPPPVIRLRRSRIPQVLGMEVPRETVRSTLDRLGFEVGEEEAVLSVKPPYWRGEHPGPGRPGGGSGADLGIRRPAGGPALGADSAPPPAPGAPAAGTGAGPRGRRGPVRGPDLLAGVGGRPRRRGARSVARPGSPAARPQPPSRRAATPCGLPSVPDSCAQPPTTWTGGRGPSASSRWDGAIARLRRPAGAPPRNGSGRRGFSSARGWIVSTARPGRASTSSTPRRRSSGCCSASGWMRPSGRRRSPASSAVAPPGSRRETPPSACSGRCIRRRPPPSGWSGTPSSGSWTFPCCWKSPESPRRGPRRRCRATRRRPRTSPS